MENMEGKETIREKIMDVLKTFECENTAFATSILNVIEEAIEEKKVKLTSFDEIKDKYIGKVGTPERDQFEEEVEKEIQDKVENIVRYDDNGVEVVDYSKLKIILNSYIDGK